ncbi:MAG: helix-turn-helix transcriptional regulator [Myxococcales bacterium]|nr:helix-turn-helix transcriptional regulator [Myxococcales bacterium]
MAELGWTHEVAAEHLGVGRVTVSRWASGARDPGEQVLRHLRMIHHLRGLLGDDLWQQAMADLASSQGSERGAAK